MSCQNNGYCQKEANGRESCMCVGSWMGMNCETPPRCVDDICGKCDGSSSINECTWVFYISSFNFILIDIPLKMQQWLRKSLHVRSTRGLFATGRQRDCVRDVQQWPRIGLYPVDFHVYSSTGGHPRNRCHILRQALAATNQIFRSCTVEWKCRRNNEPYLRFHCIRTWRYCSTSHECIK